MLASHTGAVVVVFAVGMMATTTVSEAPCLGLEAVVPYRLKTTTSGIQLQKAWRACCWLKPYGKTTTTAEIALSS